MSNLKKYGFIVKGKGYRVGKDSTIIIYNSILQHKYIR